MKKIEIILVISSLAALCLSFAPLPGTNALLIFLFMLLSTLYFYLGFSIFNNVRLRKIFKKESYVGISQWRIIGAIGTGLALSVMLIGIVFKTMFWPGAYIQLLIGLFSVLLVSIVAAVKFSQNKSDYYKKMLSRLALFGTIGFILFMTPSTKLVEFKYRNNPEYATALINTMNDPDNPEYQAKLEEIKKKEASPYSKK